jgi:hypothetical protein
VADASLDEILKTVELGPLSNNAEQHYNHSFYRKSLSLKGGGEPKDPSPMRSRDRSVILKRLRRSSTRLPTAILAADGLGWSARKTIR